jgi:hypothetical protein
VWAAAWYYGGNVSAGVGSISADPVFVSEAASNYRLQSTSPCVDAGVATALATDAEGAPRAVDGNLAGGAEPDMGAYELDTSGNAPPTAVAGGDRTVVVGVSTSFDGTGSRPDGARSPT